MPPVNPRLARPPKGGVWRVARGPDPLEARIPPADTLISSKVGNRFDSPDGRYGVLYFGASLRVCFGEILARKRPDPSLAALVEDELRGHNFMEVGSVARDWRDRRSAVKVQLPDDVSYLDVDHPDTHQFLRRELALGLAALGCDDLNIGIVRGNDRRVTRLISEWTWSQTAGGAIYGGIRYASKINSDWECWAVFHDIEVPVIDTKPITLDMPELVETANYYGLRIH